MSELDKCPHAWCYTEWHGLAVTMRLWAMRQRGVIDPDYRYRDDDSEVLCPGSLFVGEFSPAIPVELSESAAYAEIKAMLYQHLARLSNVWMLPDIDPLVWEGRGYDLTEAACAAYEDIVIGYTQ